MDDKDEEDGNDEDKLDASALLWTWSILVVGGGCIGKRARQGCITYCSALLCCVQKCAAHMACYFALCYECKMCTALDYILSFKWARVDCIELL